MIIFDLDAIKTNRQKQFINKIVLQNSKKQKAKDGLIYLKPSTPIYWFTKNKKRITAQNLKEMGLLKAGTIWGGPSVFEMLVAMVKDVDEVAESLGMKPTRQFRRPPKVFTDKDFDEINALNCEAVPLNLVEIFVDA